MIMTDEVFKQLADLSYADVPLGKLPLDIGAVATQGKDISKLQDWEIVDVDSSQNTSNGLYAVVLRSKKTGEIVVSYRGSEAFETGNINDWHDNTRLAATTDTEQQIASVNFLRGVMDKFPNADISVTGHSKGGNDALYAAVTVGQPYQDRIASVVTFNAPGFGSEFFAVYDSQIKAVAGRSVEYQNEADMVSSLLYNIGSVKISLTSDTDKNMLNMDVNHGFDGFMFNSDGSLVLNASQKKVPACNAVRGVSASVEILPGPLIDAVLAAGFKLIGDIQKGEFDFIDGVIVAGMGLAVGAAAAFLAINPLGFIAVVGTLLAIGAIAVLLTYAVVKIGELITAGLKAVNAAALAVMAFLEGLGNKLADLFAKAIDTAVKLFTAAKDAILDFGSKLLAKVGDFCNRVTQAVTNFFEGVGNWIKGLFGSASAAIAFSGEIAVTISRIDEMHGRVASLRNRYLDAKSAISGAKSVVSRVSAYYRESYVRSCCRDIESNLGNAQKYLDAAERDLERKRRTLADAVDSYRRADSDSVKDICNTAAGFA
jgi:hypothetical protein